MNNINYPALLLAITVVAMFCLVGVALVYESVLLILLFLFLGFGIMGFGLFMKRKHWI